MLVVKNKCWISFERCCYIGRWPKILPLSNSSTLLPWLFRNAEIVAMCCCVG
jgi:hypothetical protein